MHELINQSTAGCVRDGLPTGYKPQYVTSQKLEVLIRRGNLGLWVLGMLGSVEACNSRLPRYYAQYIPLENGRVPSSCSQNVQVDCIGENRVQGPESAAIGTLGN